MKAKPDSVRAAHILQKHTESRNPIDSYRNVISFLIGKIIINIRNQ